MTDNEPTGLDRINGIGFWCFVYFRFRFFFRQSLHKLHSRNATIKFKKKKNIMEHICTARMFFFYSSLFSFVRIVSQSHIIIIIIIVNFLHI